MSWLGRVKHDEYVVRAVGALILALLCAAGVLLPQNIGAAGAGPGTIVAGWSPGVARGVSLTAPLAVYFNRPMDRFSVQSAWHLSPSAPGAFAWTDAGVSFTPLLPLHVGTTYTLSIGASARSATGVPLAAPFSVRFTTGDALRVLSYGPRAGTASVPQSGRISVTFNHPMVALGGLNTPPANPTGWNVSITPVVAGSGSWLGTSTWVFHPAGALQPSTSYTVTVRGTARDTAGEPLGHDLRWSFRTVTPDVFGRTPGDGSQFVAPRANVSITFNQHMAPRSTANAFALTLGGTRIAGKVTVQGSTLSFHPAIPLQGGKTYTAQVRGSARSVNGRATLGRAMQWTFRVAPAPRLTGSSPVPGGTTYATSPNAYSYGNLCCYLYSVTLYFNTPMDKSSIDKHLTISPSVPRFDTSFGGPNSDGRFTYSIYGDFNPTTPYTVTLGGGIVDRFGRSLPAGTALNFNTSRLYPSVALYGMPGQNTISFSTGQVVRAPLQTVNVPKVDFTLLRTNLYDLATRSGNSWPAGTKVRHWSRAVTAPLNTVGNPGVELKTNTGKALPPGVYWLDAAPPLTVPGWPARAGDISDSSETVIVTDTNLTVKSGSNGTLVWANAAKSGAPLKGASIRLSDSWGRALVTGRTNAKGTVFFRGWNSNRFNAAVLNDGRHFGMVQTYWQPNTTSPTYLPFISSWFGIQSYSNGSYLYTDRPIYRPGQRLHFRGVIWRDNDGVYALPGKVPAGVTASDSYGHTIYHATMKLDRFGAVHGSFLLPGGIPTGPVNLRAAIKGSGVYTTATVADYRKPEFLTSVTPAQPSYAKRQTIHATVHVRYVFGAPVVRGSVSWAAYAQPQFPSPPGWDGYSFFDWEAFWQQTMVDNSNPAGNSELGAQIASGSGTTDSKGNLAITLPVRLQHSLTDQTITLEATVMDVNHQTVSGRAVISAYTSDLAIGLTAEAEIAPAGTAQHVDVAAVQHNGTAIPNASLTATIYKRTYTSKLVPAGNHMTAWQAVPHDTKVDSQTLKTDAHGKATLTFTPKDGGEYYITVTGKDALGNTARNSLSIYASSNGAADWGSSDTTSINLKPDKGTYAVGDTAHILVPSPFDNASALITVERNSIHSYRVQHLTSNSSTVDIPITLGDIPNVYVTVALYRGWRGTSPPDWRYGTAELHVRIDPKHLIVHLQGNGYRHHPGDRVTYSITTTDSHGHGVPAELSLALVDTAVLALQDEVNPNILSALYSERPLGVSTASDGVLSIDHLQTAPTSQIQTLGSTRNVPMPRPVAGGGGGGGPSAVYVRSHFADTAYWSGNFVTNGAGRGTLHIRLPDNATTWRLDARGVTSSTSVGSAQMKTLATQDLVLRPVLPRFLIDGDAVQVGTVLNNTLSKAVDARVSIGATGLAIQGGTSARVHVPAHGEKLLLWNAHVPPGNSATVNLQATPATSGVKGDAVRVSLPVHAPLTDETVATAGQVYASTQQPIAVPRNAVSVPGALTVSLSSSLTVGLGGAWPQFKPQRYESNDDVAERLLVAAALHALPQPVTGLSPATYRGLPAVTGAAVQKLLSKQFNDGGWPWFTSPLTEESDPFVTADALQALAQSGWNGPRVRAAIARGRQFLSYGMASADGAEQPHLLLTLARTGGASHNAVEGLYGNSIQRYHLSSGPLAELGMALSLQHDASKARSVVSQLDASVKVSATGAHWENGAASYWSGPPIANTTQVLSALLTLSPGDPLVPAAVRWLMLARDGNGWDCTHDTAQAIATLSQYARAAREGSAQYGYRVLLNGRGRLAGSYTPANTRHVAALQVPVAQLGAGRTSTVQINRNGANGTFGTGPLYQVTRLHYYLRADAIAPRNAGIAVSRRYLDLQGHAIHAVAAGSAVRVELSLHTDATLLYLNVQDPLPSGFEPIDESLNTTQHGLFGTPPVQPFGTVQDLSWYLIHGDLRDDRVSLYAYSLPPGTYRYTYLAQATVPGRYEVPPTHVSETFFPEVFGRGAGEVFTVR